MNQWKLFCTLDSLARTPVASFHTNKVAHYTRRRGKGKRAVDSRRWTVASKSKDILSFHWPLAAVNCPLPSSVNQERIALFFDGIGAIIQFVVIEEDLNQRCLAQFALNQGFGEPVLNVLLQSATQRTRAV